MAEHFDAIVIGGGIAGVSASFALSARGSVLLLEREASLAAHASGRNAAIYRPLEDDDSTAALARHSLEIFAKLTNEPVLRQVGLLLASNDDARIATTAAHARESGVPHAVVDRAQCVARASALMGGEVSAAVLLPEAGVLDIHRMITVLSAASRDQGAQFRQRVAVSAIETRAGRVVGVRLDDGTTIAARQIVIAAGAWASTLAATCGSQLALTPIRRHLAQLRTTIGSDAAAPVVWRIDPGEELYFRAESGGVLASPCDAVPVPAGDPIANPGALELLGAKLTRTAPALARAQVLQSWACLRTFAADRELVVGADPTIEGLYWFAGLGGRGMAVAAAAGQLLGTLMADDAGVAGHALGIALAPGRL